MSDCKLLLIRLVLPRISYLEIWRRSGLEVSLVTIDARPRTCPSSLVCRHGNTLHALVAIRYLMHARAGIGTCAAAREENKANYLNYMKIPARYDEAHVISDASWRHGEPHLISALPKSLRATGAGTKSLMVRPGGTILCAIQKIAEQVSFSQKISALPKSHRCRRSAHCRRATGAGTDTS